MIWQIVSDALNVLGYPLAANTMIIETGGQLPDLYLVPQLISSPPVLHADNIETMRMYRVQVSIYSRDGLSGLPASVKAAMTSAGFTASSMREIPYNPDTRHFGLAMDFIYTSDEEELEESY